MNWSSSKLVELLHEIISIFLEIILPEFAEQGDHKVNSNIVKLPENKSQIYKMGGQYPPEWQTFFAVFNA